MLIVSRRSESDEADDSLLRSVAEGVLGTAGMVTAVVGTGFGIGFSLELAVPATLIAAVLAAGIVARSASTPTIAEAPARYPPS